VITTAKLNPADFDFRFNTLDGRQELTKFYHVPTNYYFEVYTATRANEFNATFSPGRNSSTEKLFQFDDWGALMQHFTQWAYRLKNEIDAPDLWTSYVSIDTKLKVTETGNLPFTVHEHKLLIDRLNLLEDRVIREFSLNDIQQQDIKTSIENLKQKSESFGRKDWFIYFMGALQSIIINFAFDSAKRDQLGKIVHEIFSKAISLVSGGG